MVVGCGDGASALDALLLAGLVVSLSVVVPAQHRQHLSAADTPGAARFTPTSASTSNQHTGLTVAFIVRGFRCPEGPFGP